MSRKRPVPPLIPLLSPRFLIPLLLLSILIPPSAGGKTLQVKVGGTAPFYSKIQTAISAASNGDTIQVAEGTYVETFYMQGKNVQLLGGYSSDFSVRDIAEYTTIIDGNQANAVIHIGNGEGTSTKIDGFTITNGSVNNGGGIRCYNGSPVISNNIFTGNTSGNAGGGISVEGGSLPTIINNVFANNTSGTGGGLYLGTNSDCVVRNNTFYKNTASNGGGIQCEACSPTLINNIIISNTATGSGGGIGCSYSATPIITYCDVWNNTAPTGADYKDCSAGTGCISQDPKFKDASNNNYVLHYSSPCIDKGDPASTYNDPDGSPNDMGAYGGANAVVLPTPFVVSHWKFDEGSGSTAKDMGGAGNNGTIKNGTNYVDGKFDKCLSFDGTNDYVDCSNPESLNIIGEITLEAWIYIEDWGTGTYSGIISKYDGNGGYLLTINNTQKKLNFYLRTDSSTHAGIPSDSQLQLNRWYHVVGVLDSNKVMKTYVNGVEQSTTANFTTSFISSRDLVLGRYISASNSFEGKIDSARVCNRALTEEQITFEYESKKWFKYAGNPVLQADSFETGIDGSNSHVYMPVAIIKENDQYNLWYRWDGESAGSKVYISLATSSDCISWTKESSFALKTSGTSPLEGLTLIKDGSTYMLWYGRAWTGGSNNVGIFLLESTDGKTWTGNQDTPVHIMEAPYFYSCILKDGSTYKMWYRRNEDIWYATSDDGETWSEYEDNPVISHITGTAENKIFPSSIHKKNDVYCLVYSSGSTTSNEIRIAHSDDGIKWIKSSQNPLFADGTSSDWDATTLYFPALLFDDSDEKIIYRGASAGSITYKFGLATTTPPPLIAHWKFDESSGSTATDSSGRENNGTINGAATWKPSDGKFGGALYLNGTTDDYVAISPFDMPSEEFTVSFWIKSSDTTNEGAMFSYGTAGADNTFSIFNYKNILIVKEGGTSPTHGNTGISANDGTWHLISITHKALDGVTQMYKDGVLVYTDALAPGTSLAQDGYLVFGQDQDYVGAGGMGGGFEQIQSFKGLLDDVKIFNNALTADEINYDYQGLVAHYKFDESSGTVANDSTSNDNDGTLVNGPTWQPTSGKNDGALKFDGSDDVVKVSYTPSQANPDTFSLAGWFSVNAEPSGDDEFYIMTRGLASDGFGENYVVALVNSDEASWFSSSERNGLKLYSRVENVSGSMSRIVGSRIRLNTWYYFAVTYDSSASSNHHKLYINGSLAGSKDGIGTAADQTSFPVVIGGGLYPAGNAFYSMSGHIDDIRIYQHALSGTQVKEAMYQDYELPAITLTEPDGTDDKTTESKPNYTIKWTDDDPDSDAKISLYYTDDLAGMGTVIMKDDFSDGDYTNNPTWLAGKNLLGVGGTALSVVNDALKVDAGFSSSGIAVTGDSSWQDYSIETDLTMSNDYGAVLYARIQEDDPNSLAKFYYLSIYWESGNHNISLKASRYPDAGETFFSNNSFSFAQDETHKVRLDVVGNKLTAYFDGTLVGEAEDDTFNTGRIGLGTYRTVEYDNVVVRELGGLPIAGSTLVDGLTLAMWRFDGNAHDESNNDLDGTVSGAAFSNGAFAEALQCDGNDDYVTVSDSSKFDSLQQLSVEAWIYLQSLGERNAVVTKLYQSNGTPVDDSFALSVLPDGRLLVYMATSNMQGFEQLESSGSVETKKWQHVAFTYNSESGTKIYLNGEPDGTFSKYIGTINTTEKDILIGAIRDHQKGYDYFFDGLIDEVRISNTTRTAEEIASNAIYVPSIFEDSTTDSYTWDTTDVQAGEYYILAKIKDFAHDPVWSVSSGLLKIKEIELVWKEVTSTAAFGERCEQTSVVFNNQLWIIGGQTNDVWYSNDGIHWDRKSSVSSWSDRHGHTSVVFNNKLWVIEGVDGSYKNDVWYSTDGATWNQASSSAPWSARQGHSSVVFNDSFWVIGGTGPGGAASAKSDAWYSTDGVTGTQATGSAPWGPRLWHSSVVFDDKIWVIGGNKGSTYYNDVWYSSDGVTWH